MIFILAFTQNAAALAVRLEKNFFSSAKIFLPARFIEQKIFEGVEPIDSPLSEFTGKIFHEADAIIFIGACGIATRAIAGHIKSKLTDPAVIVIDEAGKFVIPILSGHVGGANELAKKLAGFLDAQAVITTATDINNFLAVDSWAVKNNCAIENPEAVKKISGAILEHGENSIGVAVTHELQAAPWPVTLWLRPRNLILGAGCNKGVPPEEFEAAAKNFLESSGVSILSLKALASIDLKADEPAMKNFSRKNNIPFVTFKAHELQALPGNFSSSQKVLSAAGVDNVCERSCMLAAGEGAVLLRSKFICNNKITFALAKTK